MKSDNLKRSNVCIVVPVYRNMLSHNEMISLCQCKKIFKNYDIIFLKPQGVLIDFVDHEKCIDVNKEYLTSRKKYSDYVLSIEFYDLFKTYTYMLIYQLDAFVFEDRLMEFCQDGYDYIGAPWLYGMECHTDRGEFWNVGNGGFSLRNINSFRNWILKYKDDIEYWKMILPEDMVIAVYGKEQLRIAPEEIALKFAFDLNPGDCYKLNNMQLPFGCHGWHKFECDFWQQQINKYGYDVFVEKEITNETKVLMNGKERRALFEKYFNSRILEICLKNVLKEYRGTVSVFGAGQYGLSFINLIRGTAIKIDFIYDNDIEKWGKTIEGIEIRSAWELKEKVNPVVLVTMLNPEVVVEQFEVMGLKRNDTYAFSRDLQYAMVEMGKENKRDKIQ